MAFMSFFVVFSAGLTLLCCVMAHYLSSYNVFSC